MATLINTFKKDPLSGSLDGAHVKWPYAHMKENQRRVASAKQAKGIA